MKPVAYISNLADAILKSSATLAVSAFFLGPATLYFRDCYSGQIFFGLTAFTIVVGACLFGISVGLLVEGFQNFQKAWIEERELSTWGKVTILLIASGVAICAAELFSAYILETKSNNACTPNTLIQKLSRKGAEQ